MKKFITLTLATVFAVSLTACQTIPVTKVEETNVIKNEQGVMEEAPAIEQEPQSEFVKLVEAPPLPLAQYRAEQRWTDELTNKDGDLTIKIDTDILTPDTDAYPVYTTGMNKLSSELVQRISNVLFEGETLYDDNTKLWIKSDYLKQIAKIEEDEKHYHAWVQELEYIAANGEPSVDVQSEEYKTWAFKDEYENIASLEDEGFDTQKLFESELKMIKEDGFWGIGYLELLKIELEDAPEVRPANGVTNYEFHETNGVYYMTLYSKSTDDFSFYAQYSEGSLQSMIMTEFEKSYSSNMRTLAEDEQLPIDTSKEEAANIASETVKAMGIEDFVLSAVTRQAFLMDDGQQRAYVFTFTPMLGSIPSEFVPSSLSTTGVAIDGAPHLMYWDAETIEIIVGDEGVVGFEWRNIGSTPEVKNENVEIMSFEDIKAVATQMLPIKMSDQPGYIIEEDESTAVIDKITLSMMRTVDDSALKEAPHGNEENDWQSTFLNGADYEQMYIPVWDFYGHYENSTAEISFLTLNAIDGTSIDRALGY